MQRGHWGMRVVCALTLVASLGALMWRPDVARACGVFTRLVDVRKPSLSWEQVLIIYDAAKEKQHFIREVTFLESKETFGFVVPTPSRPEVAKVDKTPFEALRTEFPFHSGLGLIGHGGRGFGGGTDEATARSVKVLDVSKVGRFTAFVLAADDSAALAKWLKDNGLQSTPDGDAWLDHYVRMQFFYVALRYDPPAKSEASADRGVATETIRISFTTPAPYYPYLEPGRASQAPGDRLLDLWLVSNEPMTPVALASNGKTPTWVRPLKAGQAASDARARLERALDQSLHALLPEAALSVQTFQDQKVSRVGFGDILFVPKTRGAIDDAHKQKLLPLLGILDASLVPEERAQEKSP